MDSIEVAIQFKNACLQMIKNGAGEVPGTRLDNVFNLSRVMRVIGTNNCKGQPIPGRSHRRSHFVTEPIFARSMALHHMILNTDIEGPLYTTKPLPKVLRCDLRKLENCEFIKWCRACPEQVSEPAWWALITNLAHLEGGVQLIHEISRLDKYRYDFKDTERIIQRVINSGYKPVLCKTIINESITCTGNGKFKCSIFDRCPARAPMFMAALDLI